MTRHGPRVYDWRPAPFGRVRKVSAAEAARWKDGKAWTAIDVDRLIQLVDAGHGYDTLARRLRRTRTAVLIKCKRLGVRVTTTPATLAARDVAALLGNACSKSVTRWIALGWLPARNAGGPGCKALWRIQWDDLLAFMERRDYWPTWEQDRIRDAALREWAQELRAAAGGRWISIGEVAERYCVDCRAVNTWIRKGWLPAARYGNWWIWSADLEGWLPPCERSRAGIPHGACREVVGKTEIRRAA